MAVNMPTAIGAAGHHGFRRAVPCPANRLVRAAIPGAARTDPGRAILAGAHPDRRRGAVIGTTVVIARALMLRWLKKHHVEIPPETEKLNA